MTYERNKVAPWEKYADGQWHPLREGPAGEERGESERQYRRHWSSIQAWCRLNDCRGQLSRTDHGRVLKVRITQNDPSGLSARMRDQSRGQIGRPLIGAVELLEYALHLRQHGERAPGGNETWAEFDKRAEAFLRKVRGVGEGER